jgi:hypothetical protein
MFSVGWSDGLELAVLVASVLTLLVVIGAAAAPPMTRRVRTSLECPRGRGHADLVLYQDLASTRFVNVVRCSARLGEGEAGCDDSCLEIATAVPPSVV